MPLQRVSYDRLKAVLSKDKTVNLPDRMVELVKSDLWVTLDRFLVLDDLVVELAHETDKYVLTVQAYAGNIKTLNLLSPGSLKEPLL
jgi:septum formation topological specificity factor MinE